MKLFLSISIAVIATLLQLGGKPKLIESEGAYTKYALTDSSTLEVYEADSIVAVMTVCAPQCSSCARVYNKEWQPVRTIEPPMQTIFPLASMDKKTGQVSWSDNDQWEY